MRPVKVFVLLVAIVGASALLGSIVGAALGRRGLFIGGFVGGPLGSCIAAWLGGRLHWIPTAAIRATALGASIGFLAAASIAVNTLRSPVGPVLSSLLIGVGGLIGARLARPKSAVVK